MLEMLLCGVDLKTKLDVFRVEPYQITLGCLDNSVFILKGSFQLIYLFLHLLELRQQVHAPIAWGEGELQGRTYDEMEQVLKFFLSVMRIWVYLFPALKLAHPFAK